jgi:sugar/nucleoside kinase (ribokinase family)
MSVLVIGTVALDDVETPAEKRKDVVGGSATFFSHSASPFGDVRLVAIIGEDFPAEQVEALENRGVDTTGLVRVAGKSFHWAGRYLDDMNTRETISTDLNVFEDYSPIVPEAFRESPYVFLANAHPAIQAAALDQMTRRPKFVLCDTMNLWIETAREPLLDLFKRVDAIVVNDEEARMLTGESNLVKAGRDLLKFGPQAVIVKKGEHGALLFTPFDFFAMPAYPVEAVTDPTGAGDSFAGGLMGSLSRANMVTSGQLRRGMVHGTIMASFTVESFSVDRVAGVDMDEIHDRAEELIEFFSI